MSTDSPGGMGWMLGGMGWMLGGLAPGSVLAGYRVDGSDYAYRLCVD